MALFLSADQIYRLIQRELPIDAYPDGAPDRHYSTADSYATAKVFESAYDNNARIYENMFPQTADENITDWEIRTFGYLLDASLTLQQKRDRIISKIRTRRRTTKNDILQTVYTVIDSSIYVEIVPWNCDGGSWILNVSELEISTILGGPNSLTRTGPDLCSLTAEELGLTEEELLEMREDAYTYEVRIYDYTLSADELERLEEALSAAEPARDQHIILDGLDPNDIIGGEN